jgi:hypothetical protein
MNVRMCCLKMDGLAVVMHCDQAPALWSSYHDARCTALKPEHRYTLTKASVYSVQSTWVIDDMVKLLAMHCAQACVSLPA